MWGRSFFYCWLVPLLDTWQNARLAGVASHANPLTCLHSYQHKLDGISGLLQLTLPKANATHDSGATKCLGGQSQLCHHSYLHSWWQHGVVQRARSDVWLRKFVWQTGKASTKVYHVQTTATDTSSVSSLPELDLGLCGPSTSFVVWPSAAFPFSWNCADIGYIISTVTLSQ